MLIAAALAALLGACSLESEEAKTQSDQTPAQSKDESVKPDTSAIVFEMQVIGMMCNGCKATVTKDIEGIAGVESAQVDWKSGKAVVRVKPGAKVDEAMLRAAVEKDYEVESCVRVTN